MEQASTDDDDPALWVWQWPIWSSGTGSRHLFAGGRLKSIIAGNRNGPQTVLVHILPQRPFKVPRHLQLAIKLGSLVV